MAEPSRDEILQAFEIALETQLRAVRRLRGRRTPVKRLKGLSQVDMAFEALRRAKTPLHVDDLIVAIARAHGVQPARDSPPARGRVPGVAASVRSAGCRGRLHAPGASGTQGARHALDARSVVAAVPCQFGARGAIFSSRDDRAVWDGGAGGRADSLC